MSDDFNAVGSSLQMIRAATEKVHHVHWFEADLQQEYTKAFWFRKKVQTGLFLYSQSFETVAKRIRTQVLSTASPAFYR